MLINIFYTIVVTIILFNKLIQWYSIVFLFIDFIVIIFCCLLFSSLIDILLVVDILLLVGKNV